MDLHKMCRLCAFKLHKSKDIFTTRGLLEKVQRFTDIQIRNGDGLPRRICDLCDIKLQITDEYREEVRKADIAIRALALKQIAESKDSRGSPCFGKTAHGQNCSPSQKMANGKDNPKGVCRERMRLSDSKSPRDKSSQSIGNLGNRISEKSLIYSYKTAKSLVASYKALTKRCRAEGLISFALPSSCVISDTESEEIMDERAARFAAARKRRGKKRTARGIDGSIFRHGSPGRVGLQDSISPRVPVDPFNLLRVKRVRPLVDEDSEVSSEDSLLKINSWGRETHGFFGFDEDPGALSSTESSSSGKNSCDEFRPSGSGSCSSVSTFKTVFPPSLTGGQKNPPEDPEASGNLRSGTRCPICDKILANTRGLKVHIWIHKAVRCEICEAPTETKEEFREHMQLHIKPTEPGAATFHCSVCKDRFQTNTGLNMHMRNHSKSVPATKNCPHCPRSFSTLRGFKIHLARTHSGFETE